MDCRIGLGVVNIFLIEFLLGDEAKCIEDTQSVEGQAKELCQLSQRKQGLAFLYNIVNFDDVDLIMGWLRQCYNNAALNC